MRRQAPVASARKTGAIIGPSGSCVTPSFISSPTITVRNVLLGGFNRHLQATAPESEQRSGDEASRWSLPARRSSDCAGSPERRVLLLNTLGWLRFRPEIRRPSRPIQPAAPAPAPAPAPQNRSANACVCMRAAPQMRAQQ